MLKCLGAIAQRLDHVFGRRIRNAGPGEGAVYLVRLTCEHLLRNPVDGYAVQKEIVARSPRGRDGYRQVPVSAG